MVVALTFSIVFAGLLILLPSHITSSVVAPYLDKATDFWSPQIVRPGAANGALEEVGVKASFRSKWNGLIPRENPIAIPDTCLQLIFGMTSVTLSGRVDFRGGVSLD